MPNITARARGASNDEESQWRAKLVAFIKDDAIAEMCFPSRDVKKIQKWVLGLQISVPEIRLFESDLVMGVVS